MEIKTPITDKSRINVLPEHDFYVVPEEVCKKLEKKVFKLKRELDACKKELHSIRDLGINSGVAYSYPRDGKSWIEHLVEEIKEVRESQKDIPTI